MRPVRDVLRDGVRTAVPTYLLGIRVRSLATAAEENARLEVLLAEQVARIEASLVPLLEGTPDHDRRESRDGHD
ncbi:MAG: hypothetical protein WB797_19350 [Nocardioides sp.]